MVVSAPDASSSLFAGMTFHLSSSISRKRRSKIKRLIYRHGGAITQTAAGATQLVECEELNSKQPQLVATTFVQDSVATGQLQELQQYTGKMLATPVKRDKGRQSYTLEDDARMLYHVKPFWTSTQSLPHTVWTRAERHKVTSHSSASMHEHFRKQLQMKTGIEQREIIAKALAMRNTQKEEEKEEEVRASPSVGDAAGPRRAKAPGPIETRQKEVEEEKFSKPPITPVNQVAPTTPATPGTTPAPAKPVTTPVRTDPANPAMPVTPVTTPVRTAAPANPATPATPATTSPATSSSTPANPPKRQQSTSKKQQKRKRSNNSDCTTDGNSGETVQSRSPPPPEIDAESAEEQEDNGVYFRSVWSEIFCDHSKRQCLQAFFATTSVSGPSTQESAANDGTQAEVAGNNVSDGQQQQQEEPRQVETEPSTEAETDEIICQLQLETTQDMPTVVHALYYCSGDPLMARAFLMGASPAAMWSPEDDLLLVNLMVLEERFTRSAAEEAVARGDFASMQVPRNVDEILERVQFLR